MTRLFVYEYCTAEGLGREPSDPAHSLFREGRAMRDAVAADFTAVPGVTVVESADDCDWAVIIAPEFGGLLLGKAESFTSAGCRLLGPTPAAIELTSDKFATFGHWQANGTPTPLTRTADRVGEVPFPAVLKPRDGAGSEGVYYCKSVGEAENRLRESGVYRRAMLVQSFAPGTPASVAFLVGPRETVALAPAFQHLSADSRFAYLGGELPIPPALSERAVTLGRRAISGVPGLLGYVGVDLILGDNDDGAEDLVIEINPRLTTSYVGLRALANTNLAGAMLRVASGEQVGDIRWSPGRIQFSPDGTAKRSGWCCPPTD